MRKRFERQLKLGQTPIEQVQIPLKMRDELPPILAGLQWIYATPDINEQVFQLLEKKMVAGKKKTGRPGMDLWHVLVLGLVRLALDCNYDRLEYLAHYDKLMRQIMGLDNSFSGEFDKGFHQKTISENVCHVDDELLAKINEIVAKAGRKILKKNESEKIAAKTDTYVLESNVHFPTDLNLLWDAARKCIRLLSRLSEETGLPGWRKNHDWEHQIKGLMRMCGRLNRAGGPNKEARLEAVVRKYLNKSYQLEAKVFETIKQLLCIRLTPPQFGQLLTVQYFHDMLIKHIDLIDRRLLKNEAIPHEEKLFSLFEPFTEWITKGKLKPSVELGLKLLVTTDQYGVVLDYKVMQQSSDSAENIALIERLLKRFGDDAFSSISFDKGFSRESDRELIALYIPDVIMPKKGRLTAEEKTHEGTRKFRTLRHKHSAIESNINGLEHHGLNRCPDKGLHGFKRYAGFGVLAYNLHKIGIYLLAQRWKQTFKENPKARAA